jgi:hypothetical protein
MKTTEFVQDLQAALWQNRSRLRERAKLSFLMGSI